VSVKSLLSVAALAGFLSVAGCNASDDATSQPVPAASESATAEPDVSSSPDGLDGSSSPGPSGDESAATPVVIEIKDFEFSGPNQVAPGATVMVQNNDRSTHSFTAEGGDFEEVILEGGGATGMFTAPTEPGEYAYVCKFHPEMVDTLVVG
jgi:plastocyanin